jgi:glycosyltransferase involved in cell wall biosynthesis
VHCLGFVPRHDLILLYRYAAALTFVSFFGPDNLPPLEAFASGCPVIAADVPGAAEQLGDAVLRVNPKSPEQMAKAIYTLHQDDVLRRALIQRGFVRAKQWTGTDYVKSVFDILDDLAAVRRCWGQWQES